MTESATLLTEDEERQVADCATRLRLVQADMAGLPAAQRREYLAEFLQQAFKESSRTDRSRLLAGLLEKFPVNGRLVSGQPQLVQPQPVVPETPEALTGRLIATLENAPVELRQELAGRLAAAGVAVPKNGADLSAHVDPELLRKMGIESGGALDVERLIQALVAMIQMVGDLDRAAFSAMREIRRQNTGSSRTHDLHLAINQYFAGQVESIEPALRPTISILGALLAGMLGGGKEFSRQFSQKFSPDMIDQVVESEGKKGFMGPSKEERCWHKYKSLYRDIESTDSVDRWLKDCVARFIEMGVRGENKRS